jgi:hypothetical protein
MQYGAKKSGQQLPVLNCLKADHFSECDISTKWPDRELHAS